VWPPTALIIIIIIIIIIIKLLQTYFLNKETSSPLHAAVVKAGNKYTPQDLLRANENELTTDEEYEYKTKSEDSGPKKPYTADTRMTLAKNM
jgi:uncharacterized protein YpmB